MISKLRRRMNFVSEEDGFTLIELMVVIAVLGILAGIAIPKLGGVKDKAKEAEINSIGGTVRTGLEMYYAQNDTYPTDKSAATTALTDVGMEDEITNIENLEVVNSVTYEGDTDGYLLTVTASSGTVYYFGDSGTLTGDSETDTSEIYNNPSE